MDITTTKTQNPKAKPDFSALGFGLYFTDHMLTMEYTEGTGWHDARIRPYAPFMLDPAAMVLHYGQETFEGMKAYRDKNGKITLFRPKENFERMNRSNERMCMPAFDGDFVLASLKSLLALESDWIPDEPGTSLYVRPFMFATEPHIGVKKSSTYTFAVILSPVGSYYPEGMKPTSIWVEDFYTRASPGGTGEAKTSANYAGSLKPYEDAKKKGYSQVLFLDGEHKKYVEEVGTSNAFFLIGGVLYTSPLKGTILPGVTRDCVITIAKEQGVEVREEALDIDAVFEANERGELQECFATGTAAVVSPIGSLTYKGKTIQISGGGIGPKTQSFYDVLTAIQYSSAPDPHGWVERVN